MAKGIDLDDWQEILTDELIVAFENGDYMYSEETLPDVVEEFIWKKYQEEEIDETTRDDLVEYIDDIVDVIKEGYFIDDGEDDGDDEV